MSRIVVALCLVTALIGMGISGCTWMGRTTGKAVRNVEHGADNFQKGYDEGHSPSKKQAPAKKSD